MLLTISEWGDDFVVRDILAIELILPASAEGEPDLPFPDAPPPEPAPAFLRIVHEEAEDSYSIPAADAGPLFVRLELALAGLLDTGVFQRVSGAHSKALVRTSAITRLSARTVENDLRLSIALLRRAGTPASVELVMADAEAAADARRALRTAWTSYTDSPRWSV